MSKLTKFFTRFASATSRWTGQPLVFIGCCGVVLLWALSGPVFGFSDTWQLVINTGTTIVTFLMVFLIQNTQNRDNNALHAKLDELIRISKADNYFIGIENLPQEDLEKLLAELDKLAPQLRKEAQGARSRRPRAARTKTPTGARAKAASRA